MEDYLALSKEGGVDMKRFRNSQEYFNKIIPEETQKEIKSNYPQVNDYIEIILENLNSVILGLNESNFWEYFPIILGCDSKLAMINSLLKIDMISESELIKLVKSEYKSFNKENAGYLLNEISHESLIFYVK